MRSPFLTLLVTLSTISLLAAETQPAISQIASQSLIAQGTTQPAAIPPVEPFSVTGRLDTNSLVLEDDNSYYNTHTFEGVAGQEVVIEMSSSEFDTYLILRASNGETIAQNDDSSSGNGASSRIAIVLPVTGMYTILAGSYASAATGNYSLRLQEASIDDLELAAADSLLERGFQQGSTGQFDAAIQSFQQTLSTYREANNRRGEAYSLGGLGRVYGGMGQFPQALEYFQQVITIFRELNDPRGEGLTFYEIGNIYRFLGQNLQALDQFEQSLAINRAISDRTGEAVVLNSIGLVYHGLGQYPQALEHYQQSLTISREIGDRNGEGASLNNIGELYRNLGRYPQALELYQQALTIARQIGDRAGEGTTLNNIGLIYQSLGQYPQALEHHQQSLTISREIGDRGREETALNNIASIYQDLGEYTQALEYYEQSLAISRSTNDRYGEGVNLNGIGGIYSNLGQYEQALEYYEQSLSIRREIGDRAGEGTALNNMGSVYQGLGRYPQALEHYQQSLAISREIGNRAGEGTTLRKIGQVYQDLGRYPQALEHYQQSLIISREIGDRRGEGSSLTGIGNLYQDLGRYPLALEHYQQSLVISREIGSRAGEGTNLNGIAGIYANLGQYQQALQHYEQALSIDHEIGDRAGEGTNLDNIGSMYGSLGQYPQALEQYQQALDIAREIGDRAGEGATLNNIGLVYDNLGQYPQALEQYQQALVIRREVGDRAGEGATLINIGANLHLTGNFTSAEESLFNAIAILESLRDSDLSDADKISIFETQRHTYQGLQQVLIAQNQPEKILSALEVSERGRARAFVELLSARLSDSQQESLSSRPIDIAGIQAIALQENATLVQYSILDTDIGDPSLAIWVIQPNGQIQFQSVTLADLDVPLSELVEYSRESMGVRSRASVVAMPSAEAQEREQEREQANLQQLYQLLIAPIASYLPTNPDERIVFIPQGELFLVPFPALIDANGDYLIEHHTISTAPSIQVLGLTEGLQGAGTGATASRSGSATGDVLVVGNPTMPAVWNPKSNQNEPLPGLLGAEIEAAEIAAFLGVQPLLNGAATEAAVRQRMPTARVIHLATHGLLEYGDPQQSGVRDLPGAIALAPGATRAAVGIPGAEDGLLTAGEILDMDLQAELVVLSACDTGRGRITGDGVIGLSRSLIQAGVPSVIVSLWSVPDAPTAALMTEFYRQWQQTPDKAQALRQAMLITMQTRPDPRDWAAFTLIGETE